jgi:hypothetical protein
MKAFGTAIFSLALAAYASSAALAQSTGSSGGQSFGYTGGVKDPCADDYAKFCAGVSRYGMRQCLLDHQPDFSAACKSHRKADADARKPGN